MKNPCLALTLSLLVGPVLAQSVAPAARSASAAEEDAIVLNPFIVSSESNKGYYASENVYRPEDFAASVYTKMGIDPHQILHTEVGRPVALVNNGRLIKELFV